MAMTIENTSNKIIGVGEVTILPGAKETIPAEHESNPILCVYQNLGLAKVTGKASKAGADKKADEEAAKKKAAEEAEALRQARLASLEGISEEALASLAEELGINPATCKDNADVLKKVKAALEK